MKRIKPISIGIGAVVGAFFLYKLLTVDKISKYYTIYDVENSDNADQYGIENKLDTLSRLRAQRLALTVLDPISDYLNSRLFISSWFRSPLLNRIVGSKDKSDHTKANAVDIEHFINGVQRNDLIIEAIIRKNINFDQLILEKGDIKNPNWIHISTKGALNNRNQIMYFNGLNYQNLSYKQFLNLLNE
jgi:zinc D-Ala-D-Ala carboxypeptidase